MSIGVVLLHGSGLGGWIWQKVIHLLQAPSVAIDLPGRGGVSADFEKMHLQDFSIFVLKKIEAEAFDRIVLVAHSFTGPLALQVASAIPEKIVSIVFVGAGIPANGLAYLSTLPWISQIMLRLFAKLNPRGFMAPKQVIKKILCNDLDDKDTALVLENLVPEAPNLFLDKTNWIKPKRSVYVQLLKDKSDLKPELQERMAKAFGVSKLVIMDTGHLPMIAQPNILAEILNAEILSSKSSDGNG